MLIIVNMADVYQSEHLLSLLLIIRAVGLDCSNDCMQFLKVCEGVDKEFVMCTMVLLFSPGQFQQQQKKLLQFCCYEINKLIMMIIHPFCFT